MVKIPHFSDSKEKKQKHNLLLEKNLKNRARQDSNLQPSDSKSEKLGLQTADNTKVIDSQSGVVPKMVPSEHEIGQKNTPENVSVTEQEGKETPYDAGVMELAKKLAQLTPEKRAVLLSLLDELN